jgi:hypothetical protein
LRLLAALIAVAVAACASAPETTGDPDFPRTLEGHPFLEGKLILETVKPPLRGAEAEFVVKNVSDEALTDLTAVILFYSPTPEGALEKRVAEVRDLRFSVFRKGSHTIKMKPSRSDVQGWELQILPGETVAREGDTPGTGTTFLKGALECVKVTNYLSRLERSLSFEVQNLTDENLGLLKYKVELVKQSRVVWESDWQPLDDIGPAGSAMIQVDVSSVDVGAANAVLRIRKGLF